MIGLEVGRIPYGIPSANGMDESFAYTFEGNWLHMNPLPDAKSVLEKVPDGSGIHRVSSHQGAINAVAQAVRAKPVLNLINVRSVKDYLPREFARN
jgi:hypothetical protein